LFVFDKLFLFAASVFMVAVNGFEPIAQGYEACELPLLYTASISYVSILPHFLYLSRGNFTTFDVLDGCSLLAPLSISLFTTFTYGFA
jgi:hypothetical protein